MSDLSEDLRRRDRSTVWHPIRTDASGQRDPPVVGATGSRLHLADGRDVVDGMSSWWAAIHGYRHPVLDAAVSSQLGEMAHVMFGGLTHRPAIELAELLVSMLLGAATGEEVADVCPEHRWYPLAQAPPMAATALDRPPIRLADLVAELRWPADVDLGLVETAADRGRRSLTTATASIWHVPSARTSRSWSPTPAWARSTPSGCASRRSRRCRSWSCSTASIPPTRSTSRTGGGSPTSTTSRSSRPQPLSSLVWACCDPPGRARRAHTRVDRARWGSDCGPGARPPHLTGRRRGANGGPERAQSSDVGRTIRAVTPRPLLCVAGDLVEDVVVWPARPIVAGTDNPSRVHRTRGGSAAERRCARWAAGADPFRRLRRR